MADDDNRSNQVERLLTDDLEDHKGRPLSRHALQSQRSLESYLKAGVRPRWMQRVMEIDRAVANEKRRYERLYRQLRAECGEDSDRFARRWREVAAQARFDDINALVEQHNEWYPIERQLPIDIRTGDYVRQSGRSYRRPLLGPAWVLEHFPA